MGAVQTGVQFWVVFYKGNKSFLCNTKHTITLSYVTHHDLRERVSSSDTKPLFELKNCLLEKCYNANISVQGDDTDSLELHQPHRDTLTCSKCKAFYTNYIELNSDQAAELEIQTQNQSLSEVWHSASVGLQIVLRDQKSKEGFKYQSVEIY